MWNRFWNDESGAIVSAELIILLSVLAIGMTVGLASLRDSIVTELGDAGQSFSNLDQSYIATGIVGSSAATAGLTFNDQLDVADAPGIGNTNNGRGIVVPGPVTPLATGEQQ